MRQEIKFIFFDLGRVIVNFDNDLMCRQIAEVTGVTSQAVQEILYSTGLQHRFELGQIAPDEFFAEVSRYLGYRPDFARFHQAACDIFWLNLPMLPVVAQLQAARFPMGILSNTCITHFEWCREHFAIVRDGFRCYALSCQLGVTKPDQAIFQAAARLAGVPPQHIFFMDDIPAHTDAARRVGFDAVPFESAQQIARELHARGISFNY